MRQRSLSTPTSNSRAAPHARRPQRRASRLSSASVWRSTSHEASSLAVPCGVSATRSSSSST
eukprot:scaffold88601_cov57-Phaeocystis_antarctica.AAC.2